MVRGRDSRPGIHHNIVLPLHRFAQLSISYRLTALLGI
ncbi:hypothetical protein LF1_30670 [Rubripirellula obstinata]|uniref:Uncharacterized protein n=1 Tax=Rubripirellula obstinata TaxID=406547 RepID=A0A5B1CH50_9BACT|nr:hypothetical protein LF1_30670 [Rubripirellula obstinata]